MCVSSWAVVQPRHGWLRPSSGGQRGYGRRCGQQELRVLRSSLPTSESVCRAGRHLCGCHEWIPMLQGCLVDAAVLHWCRREKQKRGLSAHKDVRLDVGWISSAETSPGSAPGCPVQPAREEAVPPRVKRNVVTLLSVCKLNELIRY